MYNVYDFIRWALTHVNKSTAVEGSYPLPFAEIGAEPEHYLYGTVWKPTNAVTIRERWDNYYSSRMTKEKYDRLTAGWKPTEYATDCQGLLDAWIRLYGDEPLMDINADHNYKYWCEDKGKIDKITRPYVIGEAVFMQNSESGRMTHVGWICGFTGNGEALVVEARGIEYGIVITKITKRSWTHRGLMTQKFDYTAPAPVEKAVFEVQNPALRGLEYLAMQEALNMAGYTDADGKLLAEDGVWGKKSQFAFDAMIADYAQSVDVPLLLEFNATSKDGFMMKATVAKLKDGESDA